MHDRLKLPFRFDVARLQAEVASLPAEAWVAHYNTYDYEGDWTGVALRSIDGEEGRLYPDAVLRTYADTPTLQRLPYLTEVVRTFECPLEAARLLRLDAGARIREHHDHRLGYQDGLTRLHVPVLTHPEVAFRFRGERIPMVEGECWYFDFNQPHSVSNDSPIDRVHLVIDCVVDDWLAGVFEAEGFAPPVVEPLHLR